MKILVPTAAAVLLVLAGCTTTATTESSSGAEVSAEESPSPTIAPFVGHYATADYAKRSEGYDWVGVTIEAIHEREAYVRVRSRGDKKRPTCTFDGVGIPVAPDVLEVTANDRAIHFTLSGDTLTASTAKEEDAGLLNFYCSGGASLADVYVRQEAPLDEGQLAKEDFATELSLQGFTFTVTATNGMPISTLVVRPEGLEIDNSMVVQKVDGTITGAEIEDLNSDGWPELVVYTQSVGSGSYGSVVAYSVNNGKSMSAVSFPELTRESAAGYMGHDEFALVETRLVRRFPLYKEGDSNAKPTGGIRQVVYGLVDGEASRSFVVVAVSDIDL